MQHWIKFAAFAPLLLGAASASAQSTTMTRAPAGQGLTATHRVPRRPAPATQGQKPVGHVFGLPVVVNAPVAKPYGQSAYHNAYGQPESSGDAVTHDFMQNR